ncbi:MAG: cupin domain-containing protein [Gammaproteobacteria bacterium]|nr:cupin domain-containing protein [Gammaproteobacteria bacterium]
MQLSNRHLILAVAGVLTVGIVGAPALYAQQERTLETPGVEQTVILNAPLVEFPGKRVLVFIGDFEPGAATPIHRHPGTEFLFVLEGEGVIEQRGRDPLNLRAGVMVLSEPDADDTAFIHQAKNLSDTNRLKTLVLIIHDEGIPPAEPLKN